MSGQQRGVWESLRHLVLLLLPTLPSAFLLCAVFALLVGLDQGVEILESTRGFAKLLCIHGASLLLGLMGWYTNRVLLSVDYQRSIVNADGRSESVSRVPRDFASPDSERGTALGHRARIWWPRFLGLLPMLGTALGFAFGGVTLQTLISVLLALFYLGFVVFRRALCHRIGIAIADQPIWRSAMPRETLLVLLCVLTLNALLFALFLVSPVLAPQWVGSAAIVFFAMAGWVTVINLLLVYPGFHYCYANWLPWYTPFVLLLLWLAAVGAHTDNHAFREAASPAKEMRADVATHFLRWSAAREQKGRALPVIIVSSEGGGARSAYWTASVLGHLADEVPGFACHVFAISGASGGSVGAATYAALIAERVEDAEVDCASDPSRTTAGIRAGAEAILARDFLAPILGGLLTSDLAQRFVPTFLFTFRDRAENFERALEWAWAHPTRESERPQRWHRDFLDLWRGDAARDNVPSLFLNLTWVESGANGVVSNLLWPPLRARDKGELPAPDDNTDLLAALPHAISFSAAAHAGARFPLVSPPASVPGSKPEAFRRVVDGGYFENSGTLTALEIERELRALCSERCEFFRLILSNDPDHPELARRPPRKRPSIRFNEIGSAFGALWNGRTAHARLAEARFMRAHPKGPGADRIHAVRVRSVDNERDPALGWFLSERSQENLRAQATRSDVSRAPRRWLEALRPLKAAPRRPE